MILLIDNYDSFVHNLARYLSELGVSHNVLRNDQASAEELIKTKPDAIILSPGPCTPKEAGVSVELVRRAAVHQIPLLGVCLGHQAIAEAFGGQTIRAKNPRHGKTSPVRYVTHPLFAAHTNPFVAWATDDGELMALAHKHLPVFGVQFHPESILTPHGHQLLMNFLDLAEIAHGHLPQERERSA